MSTFLRTLLLVTGLVFIVGQTPMMAQGSPDAVVTALKTIDPEILQYFPRWRVCEPDLQIQVYQTFALMGFDKSKLNQQNIVITSAPLRETDPEPFYDLILIECGTEKMVAAEIASFMRKLSNRISDPKRPYCYTDIPPTEPPSAPQAAEIINYMEPTNVTHAFTLSAFEQVLKIGSSGFWLKSSIGTDQVGYTYWSSGEARVQLQRPLYVNEDVATRRAIPYLINGRVGFAYRLTGSMDGQDRLLDFVPGRKLNAGSGGKIVGGLDFSLPMHPQAGISLNMEIPLKGVNAADDVDATTYYKFDIGNRPIFAPTLPEDPFATAALLRGTGQATLFYNWWLGSQGPENFFRVDLGMNYAEVREVGVFKEEDTGREYLAEDGVRGLTTWKPNEFMDWVYAKVEYRNQGAFPFGISAQFSNQILLARAYLPVLGDWLYVEGRFSTPLRDARPYEIENFFMVSPVLRLNF
jgi:hypothetical protein